MPEDTTPAVPTDPDADLKVDLTKLAAGSFDPQLFTGKPLNWAKNYVLSRVLPLWNPTRPDELHPARPAIPIDEHAYLPLTSSVLRVADDFLEGFEGKLHSVQDWLNALDQYAVTAEAYVRTLEAKAVPSQAVTVTVGTALKMVPDKVVPDPPAPQEQGAQGQAPQEGGSFRSDAIAGPVTQGR